MALPYAWIPEAAGIEPNDIEMLAERLNLLVPHAAITETGMQEDDGWSGSGAIVGKSCVVYGNELGLAMRPRGSLAW